MVFAEHEGDLSLHFFSLLNRVNDEEVACRSETRKDTINLACLGETKPKGNSCLLQGASLTSLDPDVLPVLGGHAHQEALPLGCLHLMQIVPWGPEYLVQERPRTSQPHQPARTLSTLCCPYRHARVPRGVEGWGSRAAYAQCHSPSRSAAGRRAPYAPPAPPSPHASSWWPETCWVPSQGGEGWGDCQQLLLSFLDVKFGTRTVPRRREAFY